jgi:hypothetical protein
MEPSPKFPKRIPIIEGMMYTEYVPQLEGWRLQNMRKRSDSTTALFVAFLFRCSELTET